MFISWYVKFTIILLISQQNSLVSDEVVFGFGVRLCLWCGITLRNDQLGVSVSCAENHACVHPPSQLDLHWELPNYCLEPY